jgi:2-keto-4-pentenoate hydratase/2-oxohepta-3-ene-1,7-dioic acid hydratase in catechol pathway
MRFVTFSYGGRVTYGVVADTAASGEADTFADVGAVLGARHADVLAVLRADALGDVAVAAQRAPLVSASDVTLLAPLAAPRIFCIGVNYRSHRDEMGRDEVEHPAVFVRWPSSLVPPGAALERPRVSDRYDYEGELAVVIGRPGRAIDRNRALSHVAGYACFMDGSVRDFQRHTSQFTPGKNFDRSGSFGPVLTTADEVPDPSRLELTTRVNGAVLQHSGTDMLIHDVPALIEYLSVFTTLQPGDVISTGTPGGVGVARTPPVFLKPGDTVEVDIPGVGLLRNPVVAEGHA